MPIICASADIPEEAPWQVHIMFEYMEAIDTIELPKIPEHVHKFLKVSAMKTE